MPELRSDGPASAGTSNEASQVPEMLEEAEAGTSAVLLLEGV